MALQDGYIQPTDVGYVKRARHVDPAEWSDRERGGGGDQGGGGVRGAESARKLKVSSIKSMIGHSLGAAGGIEAVVSGK
jgi:hypothetical protein